MNNHPGPIRIELRKVLWREAFEKQRPQYKTLTQTDRHIVLSHLAREVDAYLENPKNYSLEDAKFYYIMLLSTVASFQNPACWIKIPLLKGSIINSGWPCGNAFLKSYPT